MRLLPLLLAPALLAQAPAAPPAPAAPETTLSGAERRAALALLDEAKAAYLAALKLSPAQRAWKPAPNRWSVDECLEHLALTGARVAEFVPKLLAAPRDPSKRAEIKVTDAEVIGFLKDRSHKFNAPEFLQPAHQMKDGAALEAAYLKSHAVFEEAIRSGQGDWRAKTAPHPAFGVLDLYQWVLMAAGHDLRHLAQAEEVQKTPGFPAK